jgi:hypothetical protein
MRSDNMGSNFTDITYNLPDLGKTHSCTKWVQTTHWSLEP